MTRDNLTRLVEPFLTQDGSAWITVHQNRIRIGDSPAQKINGSTEEPTNYRVYSVAEAMSVLTENTELLC